MYDYIGASNDNVKCVSRMLDTSAWENDFVTAELKEKGGLAIGGPTAKMWCASWNKVYQTQKVTLTVSGTGYQANGSNSANLSSYTGYTSAPNLYFPTKAKDNYAEGYWLASPSSMYSEHLMDVYYTGLIYASRYTIVITSSWPLGIRPVVYLPASIKLKASGTANLWNIDYGE